ncbi:MAG: hypothetical protein JO154_24880 [Chitinophaga sp.]|nr:hypothetical protein [Chitinophaga sp.]
MSIDLFHTGKYLMIIPLLSLAGGAMPWSGCSAYKLDIVAIGSRLVVNEKMISWNQHTGFGFIGLMIATNQTH